MPGTIDLSEREQQIASDVALAMRELAAKPDSGLAVKTGRRASALFRELVKRKAIPEVRLRYFEDPAFNPSNKKSSKQKLFLQKAGSEEKMYSHPHFWPYLLYFIHGPNCLEKPRISFTQQRPKHFEIGTPY